MGDILKLFDWLKGHPGYAWAPLLLIAVCAVLIYKVLETLLPQAVKALAGDFRAGAKIRKTRAQAEGAIRRLCETTRNVNWVGSLPALVQFNFNVPLTEVFVPPRLKIAADGRAGYAVTFQEFLSENRIGCITGAPGSGKSTLLGVAAIAFARETTERVLGMGESRVPICFDFKDIDTEGEIPAAPELFSALYKRHSLDVEPAHILKLLEEGRCAIFLDGLDEAGAAPQRRKLLNWLVGVGASFSDKNRILITCRDTEWEAGNLPHVPRASVLPFTTRDAREFIAKWRAKVSQSPSGATARVAVDTRFDALLEELEGDYEFLASNPMLLTLGAVLLSIEIPLPRKKSHILDAFTTAMLGDWEALNNKGAKRSGVRAAGKILQELACAALARRDGGGFVSIDDSEVRRIMAAVETASGVNSIEWLDLIAMRSGLLQKVSSERWDFSNRRILEFLAARELVARRTTWQAYWKDPAWKEVLLFVAEMDSGSSKHLGWLEAQGAPDTDLHALLLLVSAIECRELQPTRYAGAMSIVHAYVLEQARQGRGVDEELLWRYLREDSTAFIRDLAAEWTGGLGPDRLTEPVCLTEMALRSGYVPIVKHVDENFKVLGSRIQTRILQVLPDLKVHTRALLLERIFDAALTGAVVSSDLWDSLPRCGEDALNFLIQKVSLDRWTAKGALAMRSIAEFPDARATAFLVECLTRGGVDDLTVDSNVLVRHLEVSGAGINGIEFGNLLFGKDNFYIRFGKRFLDIILSSAMIVFFTPMLLAGAILVKLESRGPATFRLKMIGRGLGPYMQVKYRTMRVLSDEFRGAHTARSDPRMTRLGAILRSSNMDSVPNIINVLRGDMSILGPRPVEFNSIEELSEHDIAVRKRFRPGLIGYSQIKSIGSGTFSKVGEINSDIYYAANCGFWFDVKLLIATIPLVLIRRGAY